MIPPGVPALRLALAHLREPVRPGLLRLQSLPEDLCVLLRIAAGDNDAIAHAIEETGESEARVREAASLYLQRTLFAGSNDSYRTLGVNPDASDERIKEHHRLLVRWLHPDRNPDGWEAEYLYRVNTAWHDLRTNERRRAFDARRRQKPEPGDDIDVEWGGDDRTVSQPHPVNVGAYFISSRTIQRMPVLALGLLGLLATFGLAWLHFSQPASEDFARITAGGSTNETEADSRALHRPPKVSPPASAAASGDVEASLAGAAPATLPHATVELPNLAATLTPFVLDVEPPVPQTDQAERVPASTATAMAVATAGASTPRAPSVDAVAAMPTLNSTRRAGNPQMLAQPPRPSAARPTAAIDANVGASSAIAIAIAQSPPLSRRLAASASTASAAGSNTAAIAANPPAPTQPTYAVEAALAPSPSATATPATLPTSRATPAPAPIDEAEARHLISRFALAYEAGDIDAMDLLFARQVQSERMRRDVLRSYRKLFQSSEQRSILLDNISVIGSGDTGAVIASFTASIQARGASGPQRQSGDIRFDLLREDGQLHIHRLWHETRPG
jgi:hypothetical protein